MKNKNWIMNIYEIQCGAINGYSEGRNHETAFRKAVKELKHYKSFYLAKLMRFREVDFLGKPFKGIGKVGKWKYQNPLSILRIKKK